MSALAGGKLKAWKAAVVPVAISVLALLILLLIWFVSFGRSYLETESLKKKGDTQQLRSIFLTSQRTTQKKLAVEALAVLNDKALVPILVRTLAEGRDLQSLELDFKYLVRLAKEGTGPAISELVERQENKYLLVAIARNVDKFPFILPSLTPMASAVVNRIKQDQVIAIAPAQVGSRPKYKNLEGPVWVWDIEFHNVSSETAEFREKRTNIVTKDKIYSDRFPFSDTLINPPLVVKPFGYYKYSYWVRGEALRGGVCTLMFGGVPPSLQGLIGTGRRISVSAELK